MENRFQRKGAACDPDSGNGSATPTIEPEVLPPAVQGSPMGPVFVPGANGTVDARLFYFVFGGLIAAGLVLYCCRRKD